MLNNIRSAAACRVSQQQLLLAVAVEKFAATVKLCSQSAGNRHWQPVLYEPNVIGDAFVVEDNACMVVSKWMVLFELAPRNRRWVSVSEPPLHTAHSYSSTTMPFCFVPEAIVRSRRHPDQQQKTKTVV